ncbi:MAG: hypothetical protein PHE43_00890 [Candidatus Nanoarchaeia archaeon]|nr:hypothetical protein [Candidatus Nanoarchaeia archaeon]
MANKPIKKWSSGNFDVAVWLNEKESNGTKVEFKTISLSRKWKKRDTDVWRSDVVNLRRADIPKAILLLQKAQEELYLNSDEEE